MSGNGCASRSAIRDEAFGWLHLESDAIARHVEQQNSLDQFRIQFAVSLHELSPFTSLDQVEISGCAEAWPPATKLLDSAINEDGHPC